MHQLVRARPLGGQQLQRLRELRELSDGHVREKHLERDVGVSARVRDVQPPASRTVDAILQERQQDRDGASTSSRLRDKVTSARRGVQTERSERTSVEKTRRKIAAVRRRGGEATQDEGGRRRTGKQEAEWTEKQLQYSMRAGTLEKDLLAAWQSFFAGSGASCGGVMSTVEVNSLVGDLEAVREQDVQKMKLGLRKLSSRANDVQKKVEEIQNGGEFLAELQERINAMETELTKFRLSQRKRFEEDVLEEKVLEKELAMFMEKMNEWETEPPPGLGRGGASTTTLGSRVARLGSAKVIENQTSLSRRQSKSNDDDELGDDCDTNQKEDRAGGTGTSAEQDMVNRVRRLNDAILRSGGIKGGWDDREHATFTRLLVKCGLSDDVLLQHLFPLDKTSTSNQESHDGEIPQRKCSDYEAHVARFLRACMRKVVTQSESSVRSHYDWYLQHLELVEEKKRVIQEWKIRKEEERHQIIQCGFDTDGEVFESADRGQTPETCRDLSLGNERTKLKAREKTSLLLEQWKLEKKQKDEEKELRRRELQRKREAAEAKRKQEQLDAKQKVLLYKLHKEQEAMMMDQTTKLRQEHATEDGLQTGALPFVSPTSKEDLVERSRIAIEYAKAKRLRLQQIEERRQKQRKLPPRPESKAVDESANTSPKPVQLFNPTEASKARDFTKDELRKKARRRERQGAHDAFIPGKKAIPDVKIKSYGHVPIQPRAIPAWRKNL